MGAIGKALARYIKMSPYKVRKVSDLIKDKNADLALAILDNADKRAAIYLKRVLKSAIASAKQTGKANQNELYISKILVDDGPMMRRFKAAAMGRATMIRKRTCHILIELAKIEGLKKKAVIKERVK